MKALDAICKKRCGAQCLNVSCDKLCIQPEGRNGVGDDYVIERRGCQGGFGVAGKKPMCRTGNYFLGPMRQCRARCSIHRAARGYQIVNHNNGCTFNVTNDHITAYDTCAAALIYKSLPHRPKQGLLQHFTKKLRPLYAAWVWRDDRNLLICQQIAKSVGEQAARIEVDGPAAEGILESNDIMNIKSDDTIGAGSLKKTGNILGCYGIAGLGLAILSRVSEIGHQRRYTRRAVVTQGAEKK